MPFSNSMELPSDLSNEYVPSDLNQMISYPAANYAKTTVKQPYFISPPESYFFVEKDEFSDLNRYVVSSGILQNAEGLENDNFYYQAITDADLEPAKSLPSGVNSAGRGPSFSQSAVVFYNMFDADSVGLAQAPASTTQIVGPTNRQSNDSAPDQVPSRDSQSYVISSARSLQEQPQSDGGYQKAATVASEVPVTIVHEQPAVAHHAAPVPVQYTVSTPKKSGCCF